MINIAEQNGLSIPWTFINYRGFIAISASATKCSHVLNLASLTVCPQNLKVCLYVCVKLKFGLSWGKNKWKPLFPVEQNFRGVFGRHRQLGWLLDGPVYACLMLVLQCWVGCWCWFYSPSGFWWIVLYNIYSVCFPVHNFVKNIFVWLKQMLRCVSVCCIINKISFCRVEVRTRREQDTQIYGML